MGLHDRLHKPERRQPNPNIVPLVERRGGVERRLPRWLSRSLAQTNGQPFVAVAEIERRAA